MTTDQPNEIPSDYGVIIIFCHFKHTWIHERQFSIGSRNEFRSTVTSGIPWMQFDIGHEYLRLLNCLRRGWPKPMQSAKWDHERKLIEVFADDLFLCPECGQFYGLGYEEQNQHDAEHTVEAMISCRLRVLQNRPAPAPVARQKAAHGETVGWFDERNPQRQRAGALHDASRSSVIAGKTRQRLGVRRPSAAFPRRRLAFRGIPAQLQCSMVKAFNSML